MKKGIIVVLVVSLFGSVFLSGCQDTSSSTVDNTPDNVYLESALVEFVNVSLVKTMNKSKGLEAVTVSWLFRNIAGRQISALINVHFYDKNDLLLYNDTRKIFNMSAGYTERYLSPGANKISYTGAGAQFVDHVIFVVTEL